MSKIKLKDTILESYKKIIDSLGKDFDPNKLGLNNNTPIANAMLNEDSDLTLALLTFKNIELDLGSNPALHIACQKNWSELLHIMLFESSLLKKPNLDKKNQEGFTAMQVAQQSNSQESIDLLNLYAQHNAKVNSPILHINEAKECVKLN